MRRGRRAWTGCMLALLLGIAVDGGRAPGQAAEAIRQQAVAPGVEDELHAMSRTAAVIFAGQVTAIRGHEGSNGATGVVEIEFAVDDAIRGVGGGVYILREWAGLWPAGYEPFHVGERYLMLLHAPGAAGLSSPVGGSDGAIPIRGGATRALLAGGAAGTPAAPDGRVADLRWVATRAARALSYQAEPVAHPASGQFEMRPGAVGVRTAQMDGSESAASGAPVAQGAAYSTVLEVLRGWEKVDNAAR